MEVRADGPKASLFFLGQSWRTRKDAYYSMGNNPLTGCIVAHNDSHSDAVQGKIRET